MFSVSAALLIFILYVVLWASFAIGLVFYCYKLYKRRRQKKIQASLRHPSVKGPYEFKKISQQSYPLTNPGDYIEQTQEWRTALKQIGNRMKHAGVKKTLLVHGTFMGDDPFNIFHMIENILGESRGRSAKTIRNGLYQRQTSFAKDLGNFSPRYAELLKQGTGIEVERFIWASGNHHAARLKAAVSLFTMLQSYASQNSKTDRVCLIGHSHAGQVFALLTKLIHDVHFQKFVEERLNFGSEFFKKIKPIQQLGLDLVTMGMPPRYDWAVQKNLRILHFINHRGHRPIAGRISGILRTRDGDYIQQWGVSGSDSWSPFSEEQQMNKALDEILGVGQNPFLWRREIKKKQRIHSQGHNLLIDYEDDSILPNFWKTFFGHAIYTKNESMVYHMELMAQHLYPANL